MFVIFSVICRKLHSFKWLVPLTTSDGIMEVHREGIKYSNLHSLAHHETLFFQYLKAASGIFGQFLGFSATFPQEQVHLLQDYFYGIKQQFFKIYTAIYTAIIQQA